MMGCNKEDQKGRVIRAIFDRLLVSYGPQRWWPALTAFEVMVGAVLVQNTNWANVEKAIAILRHKGLLALKSLYALPEGELSAIIRPAGYYRVKAKRLRNLLDFLITNGGETSPILTGLSVESLRTALLKVNGIGPETADSIILYAFHKPVFVVDAYTRRLLERHQFEEWESDYEVVQSLFMRHLPADVALFNEYHALIVRLGKEYKGKEAYKQKGYPLQDKGYFL